MRRSIILCSLMILLCGSAVAQNMSKPWTEWSKKDAEKLLNDSPWARTQTDGGDEPVDTTVITATESGRGTNSGPTQSGQAKVSKAINFRVRLLTAKPVREAFSRMVVLSQTEQNKELAMQLQGFIDRDFGNLVVVAILVDSQDAKVAGIAMQALSRLTVESLKDKAYLERKDGKRLSIADYKPPIADNIGGKFIFTRILDGQPFLTDTSDSVNFVLELTSKSKVIVKFKVANMTYGGKLEY